jgi:uncharacterized beta-barrel protein YwiB (DUF1934 family)
MKNIMLKITGKTVKQKEDVESHEDIVEFVTEGKLYRRGATTYVSYMESELSGMEGCKTSLTISDKKVKMKRTGEPLGIPTVIEFEKGKRFKGLYDTPFGSVGMEVLTNSITNFPDKEDGKNHLSIDYNVSLRGVTESRNKLDIEIM